MEYLLGLGPDLTHQNGYGGTVLSTIIHGSENCPQRMERDHVTCIILALDAGVSVPKRAADFAGVPEIAELLFDWCEAHPDRVTDGGAV
jgi:hypothetical protein